MSRTYKFIACLDLNYCEANISSILENGSKLGCIYSDRIYNLVDTNLAITNIWEQYLQKKPPLIRVEYKKNYFNMWFYNESNKIYLYLSPTHIGWKKRYDLCGSYGINFYRYQSFMLRLIGNNIITHFETFEYFNETFDIEDMQGNKKIYVKLYMYWPYDMYHHLKVNGKMLGVTWLDANKQPIDLKVKGNALEDMMNDEENEHCWFAQYNNIVLKFSLTAGPIFIIEPMSNGSSAIDQAELLDSGLRTTIELFRNLHVFRLITFKSDEDLININKMDD